MNDKAVCRTAMATMGLSILLSYLQMKLTEVIILTIITTVIVVKLGAVVIVGTIMNYYTCY